MYARCNALPRAYPCNSSTLIFSLNPQHPRPSSISPLVSVQASHPPSSSSPPTFSKRESSNPDTAPPSCQPSRQSSPLHIPSAHYGAAHSPQPFVPASAQPYTSPALMLYAKQSPKQTPTPSSPTQQHIPPPLSPNSPTPPISSPAPSPASPQASS